MKSQSLMIVALLAIGNISLAQGPQSIRADTLIEGKKGSGTGEFALNPNLNLPRSFVVDGDEQVFVLDAFNNRVLHYDSSGKYLGEIAIASTWNVTADEKKKAQLLPAVVPTVEEIRFIDRGLYALQDDRHGGAHLLRMQGNSFVNIDASSETAKLMKYMSPQIERWRREKRVSLAADKLGLSLADRTKLRRIWDMALDRDKNVWTVEWNRIKVTDASGAVILDVHGPILHETMSERGNLFVMRYFAAQGSATGDLSDSEISGIRIIKYSLK